MICLWAILLLAVATSSVNSQGCSSPSTHNKLVEKQTQEACEKIKLIHPTSLNLGLAGSVVSLIGGVTSTLTNLKVVAVKITKSEFTTSAISAGIQLSISCSEYQLLDVSIDAHCGVGINVKGGLVEYIQQGEIKIDIRLNNQKVIGLQLVIDALLKIFLGLFKAIVENIFVSFFHKINALCETFDEIHYLGETQYYYGVEQVIQQQNTVVANYYSHYENEKALWQNYGDTTLQEDEEYLVNIPGDILWKNFELWTKTYTYKSKVQKVFYSDQSWGTKYENLQLALSIKEVKSFSVTTEYISAEATVVYKYYFADELYFSMEVDLGFQGSAFLNAKHCGLSLTAEAVVQTNVRVTYSNSQCACKPSFLSWFYNNVNYHNEDFTKSINCELRSFIVIPKWDGLHSNKGSCSLKKNYCMCVYKK